VIALGTPAELIASLGGDHVIEFTWAKNGAAQRIDAADLEMLPGVSESRIDQERATLSVSEPHVALPAVLKKLASLELELTGLSTRHASLEDVFVKLAGRHLSEDDPSKSAEP
jgi:ABC-2 type transport system ATP-binding protein